MLWSLKAIPFPQSARRHLPVMQALNAQCMCISCKIKMMKKNCVTFKQPFISLLSFLGVHQHFITSLIKTFPRDYHGIRFSHRTISFTRKQKTDNKQMFQWHQIHNSVLRFSRIIHRNRAVIHSEGTKLSFPVIFELTFSYSVRTKIFYFSSFFNYTFLFTTSLSNS